MEFRDLKTQEQVHIGLEHIVKVRYASPTKAGGTRYTYMAHADVHGKKLRKFLSRADFDALQVPEVAPAPKS